MSILDNIVADKREEVALAKTKRSLEVLRAQGYFAQPCHSLRRSLAHPASSGIIAEFKRKSPSKGIINDALPVEEVTQAYAAAGAACLSVLTDAPYFGGSALDFEQARKRNPQIPMLRKDFMVEAYQIWESKSMGADVVLLIAAALSPSEIQEMAHLAKELGMESLLEVHDAEELERSLNPYISVVGVNNRNLKSFSEQNVEASKQLSALIPESYLKISESCIGHPDIIRELKTFGYQGFLIGESFMKTPQPGAALAQFIQASK